MTDVLIKNWCIPECCMDCDPDFAYAIKCKAYNENNDFTRQRAENCPLVKIKHSQDGDTISRADAIEAVKDAYEMDAIYKVISEEIINTLSALPSAEVVSREGYNETDGVIAIEKQSAKDVGEIKHIIIRSPNYTRYFYNESMPIPAAEPSVSDVIKANVEEFCRNATSNKYAPKEDEYDDLWVCEQCGFTNEYMIKFCPVCGARMKGGDDE